MPGGSFPTQPNRNLYNGGSEWQNDYGDLPDYYRTYYRNYDAALGRFISTDPLAEASVALSPYHYAGNEPLLSNDPLGDRRQTTRTGELISPWWDDYFGGGGSGGYYDGRGGYVRGDIIKELWMSRHGGFWERDGASGYFRSDADAFLYGAYMMTKNNGWGGNGFSADYGTAAREFNSLSAGSVSTRSSSYFTVGFYYRDGGGNPAVRNGVSGEFRTFYAGRDANQGGGWDNSKLALEIGGGIYGAMETTVRPGNQWLGKNRKYYIET